MTAVSQGLGALQRDILETLDEAKGAVFHYRGSAREENYGRLDNYRWDEPGWVRCRGCVVKLAPGAYDLRASMKYLAMKRGATYCRGSFVRERFQVAFSRAVKGLIRRGALEPLGLVPLAEAENEPDEYTVMLLADGLYLAAWPRQVRFVHKR